jgi:peptidyl-prolyl cis-trans isomerase A (cyclophilin A)
MKVTIAWAARSRTIGAPSSALSAVITLEKADGGKDAVFTIDRDAAPAAYTQTYTSTQMANTGYWQLVAQFYAQADGKGAVVGVAAANITLNADGSGIGDLTTVQSVASVTLPATQNISVGQTTDLSFTALDSAGNTVAVTPGSAVYTVTSGGSYLSVVNGQVQGLGSGAATVTVTVDGKTSAAQSVNVVGATQELETIGLSSLYGTVRVRIKGILSTTTPVSVTVGGIASSSAVIAYTDANAPAGSAAKGGAVDFSVPYGLKAGSQNLVVTLGGVAAPALAVNVSDANPFAVFTLDNGNKFVAELRQDKAPLTVANFVGLATGTKTYLDPCTNKQSNAPLYNGTTFHRCIAGFVRQGGDPLSRCLAPGNAQIGTGTIGFTLPFEVTTLTNIDGALAMARSTDINSAASQFFIDDGPQPALDTTTDAQGNPTGGYAVFGQVVEGLAVAKAITITQDANGNPTNATPTRLTSLVITGKLDGP